MLKEDMNKTKVWELTMLRVDPAFAKQAQEIGWWGGLDIANRRPPMGCYLEDKRPPDLPACITGTVLIPCPPGLSFRRFCGLFAEFDVRSQAICAYNVLQFLGSFGPKSANITL